MTEGEQEESREAIHHEELTNMLSAEGDGEEIMIRELGEIMRQLVSESDVKLALGTEISAERFAEDILGFEEVDENEGEEEDEVGAGEMNMSAAGMANQSNLGVI